MKSCPRFATSFRGHPFPWRRSLSFAGRLLTEAAVGAAAAGVRAPRVSQSADTRSLLSTPISGTDRSAAPPANAASTEDECSTDRLAQVVAARRLGQATRAAVLCPAVGDSTEHQAGTHPRRRTLWRSITRFRLPSRAARVQMRVNFRSGSSRRTARPRMPFQRRHAIKHADRCELISLAASIHSSFSGFQPPLSCDPRVHAP
jgi:hypothetical protein